MIILMEANTAKEITFLSLTIGFNQWICKSWNHPWEWKSLWLWKLLLSLGFWGSRSNFITHLGCSDVLRFFCLIVGYTIAKQTFFKSLFPRDKKVKEWKIGRGVGGGGCWLSDANSHRTVVSNTSGYLTYKTWEVRFSPGMTNAGGQVFPSLWTFPCYCFKKKQSQRVRTLNNLVSKCNQ